MSAAFNSHGWRSQLREAKFIDARHNHCLMTVHPSVRSHPSWPRLVELVRDLAFIDGGSDDAFTLASGRTSRWFFDTKPVMMHPESTHHLGALFNLRMDDLGPVRGQLHVKRLELPGFFLSKFHHRQARHYHCKARRLHHPD